MNTLASELVRIQTFSGLSFSPALAGETRRNPVYAQGE